jgi:PPP family 3-phenylpropionic acid transporter
VSGAGDERGLRIGSAWRLSVLYAALFLFSGIKIPFLPVWLDWRGLTAAEIAVISAAPLFARIPVAPAVAYIADRLGNHRGVLIALAWGALVLLLALVWGHGFWMILLLTLLISVASTSIMPLTETVAMREVKSKGLDYGRMRLWGSLSFIAASFAGGVAIGYLGPELAVGLLVMGGLATVAGAHLLPVAAPSPLPQSGSTARAGIRDMATLLSSRSFLLFLAATGCVQASHAVFYTFGTVHWQAQSLSAGWSGALWSIGVIAEIGLFAFSGAAVRALGPILLIAAGALAGVLRWTVMAFDPPLAALIGLQALHGLTFGAAHLGAVHYIAAAVPPHLAGTAQALYASVTSGIAMGAATLLAGELYASVAAGAYLAMSAMSLLGLAAVLLLLRERAASR